MPRSWYSFHLWGSSTDLRGLNSFNVLTCANFITMKFLRFQNFAASIIMDKVLSKSRQSLSCTKLLIQEAKGWNYLLHRNVVNENMKNFRRLRCDIKKSLQLCATQYSFILLAWQYTLNKFWQDTFVSTLGNFGLNLLYVFCWPKKLYKGGKMGYSFIFSYV